MGGGWIVKLKKRMDYGMERISVSWFGCPVTGARIESRGNRAGENAYWF